MTAGASLLLVEDDGETRRSIATFLRGRGHVVREVGTAADALREFEAARPSRLPTTIG